MAYRRLALAPVSGVPEARRGAVGGRFCHGCGGVYPRFAVRHAGKPMYGKDHVSAPCSNEGKPFLAGADWWEAAVELLPAPAVEEDTAAAAP